MTGGPGAPTRRSLIGQEQTDGHSSISRHSITLIFVARVKSDGNKRIVDGDISSTASPRSFLALHASRVVLPSQHHSAGADVLRALIT
jgi:hypothetical protein